MGALLQKFKLDELPQLFNVLKGEMALVGPRPDIPGYADQLEGDYRLILTLKPGHTGLASLKYRNEEQLLAKQSNPQQYNDDVIWPDKVRINKWYITHRTIGMDIKIMLFTLLPISFDWVSYINNYRSERL